MSNTNVSSGLPKVSDDCLHGSLLLVQVPWRIRIEIFQQLVQSASPTLFHLHKGSLKSFENKSCEWSTGPNLLLQSFSLGLLESHQKLQSRSHGDASSVFPTQTGSTCKMQKEFSCCMVLHWLPALHSYHTYVKVARSPPATDNASSWSSASRKCALAFGIAVCSRHLSRIAFKCSKMQSPGNFAHFTGSN